MVSRDLWPVHVTILGNFRVEGALEDVVADYVASLAKHTEAFTMRLGPRAQFGSDLTIPVLLAEHSMFHEMHELLSGEVTRLPGFDACEPSHWASGYRPHATLGSAVDIDDKDMLAIKWLTLASLTGNRAQRLRSIELL
ncbi:2'-5' RNA ligase family protein [Frondihabitans sp. PAMC 28766]|uniref:2'-5' RNA ligase family protein n=1 Tax=Frondihabitans sp. PAMC 28766 TaxID=1795630 RepID=UPI0012FF812A|nr:2'-5' RNA ligase family protein [Frondihabitans sp. PAMC 28766]